MRCFQGRLHTMFSSGFPASPESLTGRLPGYQQVGTAVAVDHGFLVFLQVPSQAGGWHPPRREAAHDYDHHGLSRLGCIRRSGSWLERFLPCLLPLQVLGYAHRATGTSVYDSSSAPAFCIARRYVSPWRYTSSTLSCPQQVEEWIPNS